MGRCGAAVDMGPYYKLLDKGVDPNEAWEKAMPQIKANMVHGFWRKDIMAGASGYSPYCPLAEVQ